MTTPTNSTSWTAGMLARVPIGPSGVIVNPQFQRNARYVSRVIIAIELSKCRGGLLPGNFGPYDSAVVLDGCCALRRCPLHWLKP